MKALVCLYLVILVLGVGACSNSDTNLNSQEAFENRPLNTNIDHDDFAKENGLLKANVNSASVTLGTESSDARANERPAMRVDFNYDFYVSRHETTCGEFNVLMKTATGLVLDCDDDLLPATNVTYYDAVLFANERSKESGFDTVYTYVSASFDSEKHCVNLEGFAYHPGIEGFRLPTEAEWTYLASQNWNLNKAWTAENSDYRLHPVCELADENEFCDVVGNAMEWVYDWLGNFRDTILENYVGAPDGGALGQRVVKGGSYRNAEETVNLFSRGDVYTVTSSTRADYVGFRLAFGAIPDAVWMGNDGVANSSRIVPLANSESIRNLTGTFRSKLAFRNEVSGNLAYVDYSDGMLSVVEIADSLDVYHPEISPDGKRVAFCTKYEGLEGRSELYVRDLNAEGTNLVKLDVESAAIPRWRVLENGDTVIVYVTDAGNNNDDAAFMSASTWEVKFAGGKFGTPHKLFDGAYHGGVSSDNALAVTGARILRVHITAGSAEHQRALDTVWYKNGDDAEQACNASLAKDSSKRTLFLDFGGKTGRDFVGQKYRTHQRLLIVDSTGKLLQTVAAPTGYSFDHSEWVSGAENLVAVTLVNACDSHKKIALINLSDSSVVDLIEGGELWHPCLWVDGGSFCHKATNLDLDSAGVYLTADGTERAKILRYRMELMWKYRTVAKLVVLGSSRASNGVDVESLHEPAVNLSYFPNNFFDVYHFYIRYIQGNFESLKYVVVSLDLDFWNSAEKTSFFYSEYKRYPGYVYDMNHDYWKNNYNDGIYWATKNGIDIDIYKSVFFNLKSSVFLPPDGWGTLDVQDSTWMDAHRPFFEETYSTFVDFLKMTRDDGIFVVGVIFPQSPEYQKTGAMGRYGLRRSEAIDIIDSLKNLQQQYNHFILMDENKMGLHDYDDSMAQDCDHLSYPGAHQLTMRLDSVLKRLE